MRYSHGYCKVVPNLAVFENDIAYIAEIFFVGFGLMSPVRIHCLDFIGVVGVVDETVFHENIFAVACRAYAVAVDVVRQYAQAVYENVFCAIERYVPFARLYNCNVAHGEVFDAAYSERRHALAPLKRACARYYSAPADCYVFGVPQGYGLFHVVQLYAVYFVYSLARLGRAQQNCAALQIKGLIGL